MLREKEKEEVFVNPKNYKHYNLLMELSESLSLDYQEFKKQYSNPREFAVNVSNLEYGENEIADEHRDYWWAIGIFHENKIDDTFPNHWKRTKELTQKLPGLYQHVVNYVKPQGYIPWHKDTGTWERLKEYHNEPRGYTVAIGIDTIPNSEIMGLEFEEGIISYANKEIVSFDGQNYTHRVWNKSNQWRVTAIIDISLEECNVC
jgi:hypothetical protein